MVVMHRKNVKGAARTERMLLLPLAAFITLLLLRLTGVSVGWVWVCLPLLLVAGLLLAAGLLATVGFVVGAQIERSFNQRPVTA